MKMRSSRASAFSLIEVTMAIGIASFGLLTVFGLLPAGLNTTQASIQQTGAGNVVAGIVADLQEAPTAGQIASASAAGKTLSASSPRYGINVSSASSSPVKITPFYLDEGGTKVTSASSATARYQVNVTIMNPQSTTLPVSPPVRTATMALVQISWPAAATPANAQGSLSSFVALDIN